MENLTTFDRHPPDEFFEQYIFARLDESQCARFEEHLLVCAACRDQLENTDEYVRLMKTATAQLAAARPARPVPHPVPLWRSPMTAILGAAAVMAVAAVVIPHHSQADRAAAQVQFVSFRGGAGDTMAHARAGAGIDITIDCTEIGESAGLRLEIVEANGRPVWSGAAESRPGSKLISAHVLQKFRAGVYWVRLYSRQGELLREFGLRAD